MINQFLEIKVMQLAYELVDRYGLTKRQALEEIANQADSIYSQNIIREIGANEEIESAKLSK